MNALSTPPVRHPLQCCSQTVCDNMFGDNMPVAQTAKIMKCLEGLVLMNSLLPTVDSRQQLYKTDDLICITLHALQHHPDQQGTNPCLFFVWITAQHSAQSSQAESPTRNHVYVYGYMTLSQARWASTAPQVSQSAQVSHKTVWTAHNLQHTFFIYYSIIKLSQTNVIFCKSTNTHTQRCSIPF